MKRRTFVQMIPFGLGRAWAGQTRGAPKRRNMSSIVLEVKPASPLVLSGEAVPVVTTVHNHSGQPVWTRSEMQPSSFVYRVEPVQPGREAYILSEPRMVVSLKETPTKPDEVRDALEVPAGQSEGREEEIASLSREPFAAGRYQLRVMNEFPSGQVTSAPVALEVAVPKIGAFVSQFCPLSRTRSDAFAHHEADGRITIFQRETRVGKPVHSVYFRREQLAKGSTPQLALAVKLGPTAAFGRWMAVLNQGKLDVLYCHGNAVAVRLDPARVDLADARLLATGFENAGQEPVFLIASGAHIHGFQAHGKQISHAWSFALPLTLTTPHFVRAKPGDGLTQVTVVLVDAKPNRTRAAAITYDVAGNKTSAPVRVADVEGRMGAADMSPLEDSNPAAVGQQLHLLMEPDPQQRLAYYTMPISGAAQSPEPRRFAGPVARVDHWSITSALEERPVLAQAGPRLLVARSAGAAWSGLASAGAPLSHAILHSENAYDCWAEWLDPEKGFRLAQVIGQH